MSWQLMSSTSKTSETRTSCKRNHTGAHYNSENDSGYEAGLSLSPASELCVDCSDTRLPHKKRRKKERPGLHPSNAADVNTMHTDHVQMFGNGYSSTRDTTCRDLPCFSDQRQMTLTTDEQPSSNFEELLFGLISENECSQLYSQNRCTADVDKRTREEDDIQNDTSSDSSYTASDQIGIPHSQCSERFGETGCVLNSHSNPSNAESTLQYITTARSVDSKAGHLNLPKKQNKDVRCQKLSPDYAKLCKTSDCREKKPKLKKHKVSDEKYTSSLTNKHDIPGKTGAVYGKTTTQTTEEEVSHCLELKSDVETVLYAESSTCDVPKSSRKHKKHGTRKKDTENNSHSMFQEQKRHLEQMSSLVHSVSCNSDGQTMPPNTEHCTVNNERMTVENYSVDAAATVELLDASFSNVEVRSYDEGRCSDDLSTSCNKQNVFKKPGTLTEDCTKLTDLQTLSHKKRKKKRRSVDDEESKHTALLQRTATNKSSMVVSNDISELNFSRTKCLVSGEVLEKSGQQQKSEKLTEVVNELTERNEADSKNSCSESTPCKKKSKKKKVPTATLR